jgi:hypothetical protein
MVWGGGVIEASKWWNGGCEDVNLPRMTDRAARYLCEKASAVLVGEHP